jgi:hypothetical protein
MKIAQLGFGGGLGIGSYRATIRYTTIQHVYGGAPTATFTGANGAQVPLFNSNQRSGYVGGAGNELAFQFGHWLVIVDQPIDSGPGVHADIAARASKLTGSEDANGYLLLHAQDASVAVGDSFEGGFGQVPGNYVELAAHLYCGQVGSDTSAHRRLTNGDGSKGVSWCDGDLHVSAGGTSAFLDLAATKLYISPLGPATIGTPVTSSTTTTTPLASAAPAVSASFVSPDQGWALESNGRVDETTDAGATWHPVGSVTLSRDLPARIRFADATHGYAFTQDNYGASVVRATTDRGATWTTLDTPFSSVYDLAISHGVVYAVAFQSKELRFHIWSSPVGRNDWTEDPLAISPGAGPVPSAQLVLSGTEGWVLVDNRTVVAGARLGPDGHWATWKPPCADAGGPAELSASSGADLAAVCNEGVYTGPAIRPAFYVSHNGGRTFTRHDIPIFGSVASPYPNRAIVVLGNTVQRTTDDGVTWQRVVGPQARVDSGLADDLGFTTTTQGFIVLGSGEMLMTHDAGATWQAVTLP